MDNIFDVIVIGGGHAGCEAAYASAKMGCRTALISLDPTRIAMMSCNPAIGGLAKGQLVKEIDALGGLMGEITDRSAIQYRRLNSSKGPAVRSSRAQCDKVKYAVEMQKKINKVNNIFIVSDEAVEIIQLKQEVTSVLLRSGKTLNCKAAIVTTGTFLRGRMFTGFETSSGGRVGDGSAEGLSASLEKLGFSLRRLKTGTPPRLHRKSIRFDLLEEQPGDEKPLPFSFYFKGEQFPILPQVSCYITYTNEKTHEIIVQNFDRSPMFTGMIQGVGPRYCPSIEDKVKRFHERDRHQLFLEPEGLDVDEIYVNGISTSLPADVQEKFVRSIVGLENAEFLRHGYAVEYDSIDARQLKKTLESKEIKGLFCAGQINGTSGYEEAGAQGLIAGINAALYCQGKDSFSLSRFDGYIGVLIDDLVTRGSDEPYRMFTSRAEYRLLLREDNADLRLSERAYQLGLLDEQQYEVFSKKRELIEKHRNGVKNHYFFPNTQTLEQFKVLGLGIIKDRVSAEALLRRPEVTWKELCLLGYSGQEAPQDVAEQVEIQVKYDGYIKRDEELLGVVKKSEETQIFGLDFNKVPGLSNEIKGRLSALRPETLGQAARMQGVTPAAVANILIYLKMNPKWTANKSEVRS